VIPVASTEEAIALANDTTTGSPPRSSPPISAALRSARAIRAGTVTVNCFGEGDITTPFGGYKQSGFGGRDNGMQAHDQFTETQDDLDRPCR
jgi:gamma-glutamyl-gamma-aminobutyraldehyde dehydrogenase